MKQLPGMKDLIQESPLYREIENEFISFMIKENFKEIRTPILEDISLFKRSAGDGSDIVQKEMFETKDGLVLRPENTAPVVRSFISENIKYSKYCYFGPQFRKERPQLGRLRQFYQYGFEIFGENSPQSEIESLFIISNLYKMWNLEKFEIIVNYLGNKEDRQFYLEELSKFLNNNKGNLSESSQKKLDKNILRILDSKDENDKKILKNAPKIIDFLSKESMSQYNQILDLANTLNINLTQDPFLVRGLDYYTGFVFEVIDKSNNLGSQSALGGGGRYDNLTKDLGGKESPAFGFAGGLERLILATQKKANENLLKKISIITSQKESISKFLNFKEKNSDYYMNILFETNFSFKKVFKRADQMSFDYILIEGSDEFSKKCYKVKNLKTGVEFTLSSLEEFISLLKD